MFVVDEVKQEAVYEAFERSPSFDDEHFHYNFVGSRVRHEFERPLAETLRRQGQQVPEAVVGVMSSGRSAEYDEAGTAPCKLSEDFFEWSDLLEAILDAGNEFAMVELGAGYGRWIVNAAQAIRRRKTATPLRVWLCGVEANATRFRWMQDHFRDNDIDPAEHLLLNAAVATSSEYSLFTNTANPEDEFGAGVYVNPELEKFFPDNVLGVTLRTPDNQVVNIRKVETVKLDDIIGDRVIDFMDVDIQGAELAVISANVELIAKNVKRLHIGTHGPEIERQLCSVLANNGFFLKQFYLFSQENNTPYGSFRFIDGIQSWMNLRFETSVQRIIGSR